MAYQAEYLNPRIANDADARPLHPVRDYGIVLAGKTGSGKSATGNTILGRKAFDANPSGQSVTSASSCATSEYGDRTITVVDTPGIHDNVRPDDVVKREYARMAFLLREGVHCFVICLNSSEVRVTKETKEFLDAVKVSGHTDFYDHCMLVYTKPEAELLYTSLEEFVERQKDNEGMKYFLEKLGDRVMAVSNNTKDPGEDTRNKDAIIAMVDKVIENNMIKEKPIAFTNDTFEKAKELRKQVVTLVERESCHPSLVNAVIEAVIWHSNWGTITENAFVEKVIDILCNSEQCKKKGTKLVFRNDEEVTTILVVDHIKMIYQRAQSQISLFYTILGNVLTHKEEIAYAAGVCAVLGCLDVLGLPPVILYTFRKMLRPVI